VVGEARGVLVRVGSLAAALAQLPLQGQQFAEEGGPLRRVGFGQEVLDPRLVARSDCSIFWTELRGSQGTCGCKLRLHPQVPWEPLMFTT
jgi:hypothetical protein